MYFNSDPRTRYNEARESLAHYAYMDLTETEQGMDTLIECLDDNQARIALQAGIDILSETANDSMLDLLATEYGCLNSHARRLYDHIEELAARLADESVSAQQVYSLLVERTPAYI